MNKTTKVVLIFTALTIVCLIGAGIVVGFFFGEGNDFSSFYNIFGKNKDDIDESLALDLTGVTEVSIDSPSGYITVSDGEPAAQLNGVVWTAQPRDKYLTTEKKGSTLYIRVAEGNHTFWVFDVTLNVYLPKELGADIKVSAASAAVQVKGLNTRSLSVGTASGEVSVTDCSGSTLKVSASSGSIVMKNTAFLTTDISCTSGSVYADEAAGAVTIHNTSGGIEVRNLSAVIASLEINNISGSVTAQLNQADTPPIKIGVTSGGITLALDKNAAFDLSAGTTSGGVNSEFGVTVSGTQSDRSLSGKVNGGGAQVTLSTVSGSISVNKND